MGLAETAASCHTATSRLVQALTSIEGVEPTFEGAIFNEAVLRLPGPVAPVLEALAEQGILGGYDLSQHYPELGHALLVCATETRTQGHIDFYTKTLASILEDGQGG